MGIFNAISIRVTFQDDHSFSECKWESQKLTFLASVIKAICFMGATPDLVENFLPEIAGNFRGRGTDGGGSHGDLPQVSSLTYQQPMAQAVLEVTKYHFWSTTLNYRAYLHQTADDSCARRRDNRVTERAFMSRDSSTLHVLRCTDDSQQTVEMGHSRPRWSTSPALVRPLLLR